MRRIDGRPCAKGTLTRGANCVPRLHTRVSADIRPLGQTMARGRTFLFFCFLLLFSFNEK